MLGIIGAILVALYAVLIGGNTMEAGFLFGMNWPWYWYWFLAIFKALVIILMMGTLAFKVANTIGPKVGRLLGFVVGGGALSIMFIVSVMISHGMLLGGTYLLMTSGTPEMTFADFNTNNLIIGAILIFIGIVMSTNRDKNRAN